MREAFFRQSSRVTADLPWTHGRKPLKYCRSWEPSPTGKLKGCSTPFRVSGKDPQDYPGSLPSSYPLRKSWKKTTRTSKDLLRNHKNFLQALPLNGPKTSVERPPPTPEPFLSSPGESWEALPSGRLPRIPLDFPTHASPSPSPCESCRPLTFHLPFLPHLDPHEGDRSF